MDMVEYTWTDGLNKDFEHFYQLTEAYYSKLVGGICNRKGFLPYNILNDIPDVLIAYMNGTAIGCAGFKEYSQTDAEIKRVWVQPEFRGKHIASDMMSQIENKIKNKGYKRAVLQTREIMTDAIRLYEKCGYFRVDNYPPYDHLDGAICFAKLL